jgi:surface polysaccharide O-acyltransferase-like enzyme
MLTFLVRLVMPMDTYTFRLLNLQLPFFVPYIALFIVGLIAFRRNWLVKLPEKTGRAWSYTALGLILAWAPLMLLGGAVNNDLPFKGGLHWQAAVYALWESFMAIAMSIAVIYVFRRYFNRRGRLAAFLIPNAYAAYLIHAFVIVGIALAVRNLHVYPLLKWVLVAPIALAATFGLAALVRKLPFTERVL